ncbi:MAG: DNA polymerase IV [Rhodospirillaceae bacterium]|jgi:DNA polymerase IV|nr:DNA polymerase IV [Rhodospirillaceae bacterium]MBT5195519.1 DNA polymerase IV [Rhodospirillaceae bacterium]MBT5894779.1 DNA polymerase IV [Rhodospirillaceae bacterium]MBT6426777.1 DNA polymerase IV [Rhodospirillaceae bacterium]MBT7759219.1 DNA polymerase IV [Rhodospirillaceae bacterium]
MAVLCRDCLAVSSDEESGSRCQGCGSPRLLRHPELFRLGIAHLDCDAFYASVEKRDDPSLADKPVIVGGGQRGVVSAACYVARTYGIRSAMPMFKARKACPKAVVIKPDMSKYVTAGRQIRAIMKDFTPLVEPLSLDEAFLDLTGTERLHGQTPAATAAAIVKRIEAEVGVSASIGLSYNKSLAKVASDLDKPRGFAVIGRAEAVAFLAEQPVSIIWGAGKALQRRLAKEGITTVAQLQAIDETDLIARYGAMGQRMAQFVRGDDPRSIKANRPTKSISSETTFQHDITNGEELRKILWRQAERVARRIKTTELAGTTVVLKLRRADFRILTRSRRLPDPTRLADNIFRQADELLAKEINGTAYRLLGVGLSGLVDAADADPLSLADPGGGRRADAERALDHVRERFGVDVIGKGRGLR